MVNHPSREGMLAGFGPFRVVFEPIGDDRNPYLALLGLHRSNSLGVVRIIRDIAVVPGAVSFAANLLRDVNWRPHLVGAIAAFYNPTEDTIARMWAALDAGSWVTPQLGAILSKCDTEFIENATTRLANCCPLSRNPAYSIASPVEQHSAQGPANSYQRSSKAASSLLALLAPDRASDFASNDELQSLIEDDRDGSANIATSWLGRFLAIDAQLQGRAPRAQSS